MIAFPPPLESLLDYRRCRRRRRCPRPRHAFLSVLMALKCRLLP